MKGQVSIEFISLLTLALLASAVLVTELNDRAIQYSQSTPYSEAQEIAQKTAYTVNYVRANENSSKVLDFDPSLEQYNITVGSGQVSVRFESGSSSFPTSYEGSVNSLNSTDEYIVRYDDELVFS